MTQEEIKNKVAIGRGYPNWEEYYNWVSRSGQFPSVTAQMIEAAMEDVSKEYAKQEAVGFAEFIDNNYWRRMDKYMWHNMVDNTLDPLSTEQLYTLYTNRQN